MEQQILIECLKHVDAEKREIYTAAVYDVLRAMKKLGFIISEEK